MHLDDIDHLRWRFSTTLFEDTTATRRRSNQLFGPDMGRLVEGLTKLKKAVTSSPMSGRGRPENLRKLACWPSPRMSRPARQAWRTGLHNSLTLRSHCATTSACAHSPTRRCDILRAARGAHLGACRTMREELAGSLLLPLHSNSRKAYKPWTERLVRKLFERNRHADRRDRVVLSQLFAKKTR